MSDYARAMNMTDLQTLRSEESPALKHGGGDVFRFVSHDRRRELMLTTEQSGLPVYWDEEQPVVPDATAARQLSLAIKRAIDVIGAALALIALGPLLLLVALVIRLTDNGPALFRQERVGLDGRTFRIFKFRSMYTDLGDITGVAQTQAGDPRVTPIGRFIRKTSIDELPQLLNVLNGEMSLVGPRPHVAGMMAAGMPYEQLTRHYDFRNLMRPGITGWAQCNKLRGSTADEAKAMSRVGHDIAYIQNYSLALDAKVIFRTIQREFLSGSAH